jgi:uncharacterized protein (DUF608 family)
MLNIRLGRVLFEFSSLNDWARSARRRFRLCGFPSYETVCIDQEGRICASGKEFERAKLEESYPIKVYHIDPEVS